MSQTLEERVAALEELVPKLHAANYAHTITFSVLIRFIRDPDQVIAALDGMSEQIANRQLGNVQGLTPEQQSIAADVIDSIAQNIKRG